MFQSKNESQHYSAGKGDYCICGGLRMNLRYLRSFHSEFYETFWNSNVSVGIYVSIKKDQNFRPVKHPQEVQITKPGNFQMLGFPSLHKLMNC